MRFIFIHKDKIFNIPPLISAMYILRDLGHEVDLITCGINEQLTKEFSSRNIQYAILPYANAQNNISKVYEYWRFKKEVECMIANRHDCILWIEGAYTIRALGDVIKGFKYILQISELHENSKPQLKAIGKVIKQAKIVFMPEYNRSALYQVWFKLRERPIVLPNKPYFVPGRAELESLKNKYSDIIKVFEGKKVILYQGYIDYDRDISAIISAVKKLGGEFQMVLVGKDMGILRKYKEIDPNVIHVDFIPAPDYLLLTSMAYIGVLTYTPIIMNNIFCAPNKIFEYGAFGLPMIGNDIPGLKVLNDNHSGVSIDINIEENVLLAIKEIDKNYKTFSEGSKALYEKTDNLGIIKNALNKVFR